MSVDTKVIVISKTVNPSYLQIIPQFNKFMDDEINNKNYPSPKMEIDEFGLRCFYPILLNGENRNVFISQDFKTEENIWLRSDEQVYSVMFSLHADVNSIEYMGNLAKFLKNQFQCFTVLLIENDNVGDVVIQV